MLYSVHEQWKPNYDFWIVAVVVVHVVIVVVVNLPSGHFMQHSSLILIGSEQVTSSQASLSQFILPSSQLHVLHGPFCQDSPLMYVLSWNVQAIALGSSGEQTQPVDYLIFQSRIQFYHASPTPISRHYFPPSCITKQIRLPVLKGTRALDRTSWFIKSVC